MIDNLILRRVKNTDILDIQDLFFAVFKKKISKKFYLSRFLVKRKFNSFICIYNDKIIAHVGLIMFDYGFKTGKILSRHSSFVDKRFRKKGIYKKISSFAYEKMDPKKQFKIVTWPNKINYKLSPHTKNYIIKNKYFLYQNNLKNLKYNSLNKFQYNLKLFKRKSIRSLTYKEWRNIYNFSKKQNNLILKNKFFFNHRFSIKIKTDYYCQIYKNQNNNGYLFYSIRSSLNNSTTVDILSYFGDANIFDVIVMQLLLYLRNSKKNYIIQFFLSSKDAPKLIFLNKIGFIRNKNIFNVIIMSHKEINNIEKEFINNSEVQMIDTDVFININ